MTGDLSVPLHLAVHVLGLTVALGLAGYAFVRRRDAGSAWPALVLGGLVLAGVHVATGALLTGDATWPLYARAAAYALIAIGAAGRLVGATPVGPGGAAPVVVAIAPLTAHVAAAVAGAAAAVASLRGVLRGRSALLLAAGLASWATADVVVRSAPTAAGVVSVAGSVSVGAWLTARARDSFLARTLVAFVAVLLVLVVGLAAAGGALFTADLAREQVDALDRVATTQVQQFEQEWPRELADTVSSFAGNELTKDLRAVASGQRADLDQRAQQLATQLPGVDLAALVSLDGAVVGSYDVVVGGPVPPASEVVLAGHPVVTRALPGDATSGLVAIGDRDLLAVAAVPVAPRVDGRARLDERAGVLLFARRLTDPRPVDAIAEVFGGDATVVVGGEVAVTTLPADASAEVARLVRRSTTSRTVEVEGAPRFLAATAVEDAEGADLGWLVLTLDASTVADIQGTLTRSVFWAATVGLLVAALIAAGVAGRVTRPVRRLTAAAERVAAGDLDTRVGVSSPDELGRLAASFDTMTGALQQREEDLRAAAATEAELRSRLETVTASMGEGLLAVDGQGRVRTANPAAAQLLGRTPTALVGADVRRVLVGTDEAGAGLLEALGGPAATGPAVAHGTIGEGVQRTPVAATAAPLVTDDGTQLGRVYVLRDVTGEVEVERMKTEFLSNISHELRTPLTPIKGYAEVLRSKELPGDRVQDFAGSIADATRQLERIIGMLVDFAALEAGRIEVRLQPTDVGDAVDDVLTRWRDARPERRFVRRIERGLPPVQVDPGLLDRVLEELVDNAVKFSQDTISIYGNREDDATVRLTVRDRGRGIDAQELATILRDFHQADGSATRRYGGLGLGLSIVQRITERFNAEIVVESEPDEGTYVHLLLPVAAEGRSAP